MGSRKTATEDPILSTTSVINVGGKWKGEREVEERARESEEGKVEKRVRESDPGKVRESEEGKGERGR